MQINFHETMLKSAGLTLDQVLALDPGTIIEGAGGMRGIRCHGFDSYGKPLVILLHKDVSLRAAMSFLSDDSLRNARIIGRVGSIDITVLPL